MIARITDRVFEPDDDALGQNEVPYLLKDLYTVAGLADERGWPVERYDYDAYGKVHMNRCAVLPWAADFDGDGDVDQNDLTVFLDAYGGSGQAPNGPRGWRADLDGDGDVDGSDYLLFADAYNGAGTAPRGNMSLQSGSMVVSRVGNPFFFTGRRLDVMDKQTAGTPHHFTDDYVVLQLYDFRARTMDPVHGRFAQTDPQGHRDSVSLYEYVRSVPTVSVDPIGEWIWPQPPQPPQPNPPDPWDPASWLLDHYYTGQGAPITLTASQANELFSSSLGVKNVVEGTADRARDSARRLTCDKPGGRASGSQTYKIPESGPPLEEISSGRWRFAIQTINFWGSATCTFSKTCCPCSTSKYKTITTTCTISLQGSYQYYFKDFPDYILVGWGDSFTIFYSWTKTQTSTLQGNCN